MSKPIRIAHIMGKMVGGGVESVVLNYYRHIDRKKIQFDFLCDEDSTDIPYEEIESLGGRVIIIPSYHKIYQYQKELIRIFKKEKYKIVHSHVNALTLFSLRAAKRGGVPTRIAHSHSTSNKKELKKTLVKNLLKPFSKVYATNYFACSEKAGRWLFGNKSFNQGKVTIVNNAIDVNKFAFNREIRHIKRKELGIRSNTFVIGHIGRFVAQKNHSFLIDIFNEVYKKKKNTVLLLIGQGPNLDKIKAKVRRLKLSKCVKFLGQREDVSDIYQAFDLFLLPSLYEGLPVVGVEAQTSGLPCVLSDNMTKETKILDSTIFVSHSYTASEWGEIILDYYQNFKRKDGRKEISKNGFNIEDEACKLENKYFDLIGN